MTFNAAWLSVAWLILSVVFMLTGAPDAAFYGAVICSSIWAAAHDLKKGGK
jgi:hypothetical protein